MCRLKFAMLTGVHDGEIRTDISRQHGLPPLWVCDSRCATLNHRLLF